MVCNLCPRNCNVDRDKKLGYCNVFSIHKPNRKLPYNKDNLEFGLFINKIFFTIQELKQLKYIYNFLSAYN